MKVLHVSGATAWGGNEQQLMDVVPALTELNVNNLVFGVKDSPLHNKCKENQIPFIFSQAKKFSSFANYTFFKTLIKTEDPDIIHLHTSNSVTLFVIADLLHHLKKPTVFSKKGMGKNMSWLSLYKYNYKNINAIFCVSDAVKTSMKELVMKPKNHDKLKVIYEGVSVERITKDEDLDLPISLLDDNRFLIGNIANHVRAKDLKTLIKAIDYLVKEIKFNNFHLYQIGNFSSLTNELKDLIKELNLEAYITFTGFLDGATRLLSEFDVYVMSSEREGLPLTIYEAFYKQTPIVSTKAGGIPEVIEDGLNGYLVDVHDYKALAEKIHLILKSEAIRTSFSKHSAKSFKEKYEVSITAQNILQAYKSAIL